MNYFLLLLIFALGAGGYYEYTILQDLDTANKEKFAALDTKIDALQAENKKLEDDEKQLADSVAKAAASAQVSAPVQAPPPVAPAPPSPPPTPAPPPPPARITNDLGAIVTAEKTYQNCHLLSVKTNGIVVKHADGISECKFSDLRPELQKRFGYDSLLNTPLTPQQVQAAELQRQAAEK